MPDQSQGIFHSKKFFAFKLVVAPIVVGVFLALTTLSCSTLLPGGQTAQSQAATSAGGNPNGTFPSFRAVAAKVLPVVVEINVVDIVKQPVPDVGHGWPWNFLLPQDPGQDKNAPKTQEFRQEGLGSGVIVRKTGDTVYVLTNNHVVGNASEINLVLYDKRQYRAKLVGKDPRLDLALVSFTTHEENIPVATLGNSNDMQVGDWVLAVGNPFGFMSTVTAGIVSAIGREGVGPGNTVAQFIQTDAAINRGNSGGALVDMKGQVVGINSWIASPAGGSVGLGFAIAINDAKRAINDFIEHGVVQYGWLGVSVQDPYPALATQLGVKGVQGSLIYHVFVNSPADKGGLKPGDFVKSINGEQITDTNDLIRVVGDLPVGKDASFSIIRYGHPMTVTVRIALRQTDSQINKDRDLWPGLTVIPIDDQIRQQLKLSSEVNGLVVADVIDGTPAAVAGIQQGDVVQAINDTPTNNAIEFYRAINESRTKFDFKLERQGKTINIAVERGDGS